VHLLRLGGPAGAPLAPTPDGVTLAAAKGQRTIVVGTSTGELLVQSGVVWVPQPAAAGARQPAFPG
ncbi:MAG TPA: LpqB family beta-propeller domain-containing protein, partial [Actinomycetales bacterium]|nr:LpqB family beta-propeller domain-containing protein [Actinomycetales bacterium]